MHRPFLRVALSGQISPAFHRTRIDLVLFGAFFQKIDDRQRIGYFLLFFPQAHSQHIPSSLLFDVLKLMVV
jgi:hypothetical protein